MILIVFFFNSVWTNTKQKKVTVKEHNKIFVEFTYYYTDWGNAAVAIQLWWLHVDKEQISYGKPILSFSVYSKK